MSYQTFAITIRPRGGVTPDDQDLFDTWVKKKAKYYFLAKEKKDTDGEHIHAGIVMPKEWKMSNMRLTLKRLFPTWEEECLKHGIKCTVWYSIDFYEEYCQKEDDENIYDLNMPEDHDDIPFPPKDDKQMKRPISIWYHNLEEKWLAQDPVPTPTLQAIKEFVMKRMVVDRDLEIIADPRVFSQRCEALQRYINQDYTFPADEVLGCCNTCKKRKSILDFY